VGETETAVQEVRERLEELEKERAALRSERDDRATVVAEEATLRERRPVLASEVKALGQIARQRETIAGLRSEHEALGADESVSQRHLESLRAAAAGLLAADLAEGAPCPVCGSTHHPAPHHAADAATVTQVLDDYGEERGKLAVLSQRIGDAEQRVAETLAEHGWSEGASPEAEAHRQELEALGLRLAAVEEAKQRLAEIDERLHAIDEQAKADGEGRARLSETLAVLTNEVKGLRSRVEQLGQRIAPELRAPGAFEQRRTELAERVTSLRAALDEARKAHAEAASRAAEAKAAVGVRHEAAEKAAKTAAQAEAEFLERLHEEGFDSPEALAAAELAQDALTDLATRVEGYDGALREARSQVATLAADVEGKEAPDLEALAAASEAAQAEWQQADETLRQLGQAHAELEGIERDLTKLEGRYETLVDRVNAAEKLASLAAGRLTGRAKIDFETFVLQSIVADVLSIANHHLHRMTDGRYSLHLVTREDEATLRGLKLEVADNLSGGERRPVHTLSGGEGFLASLALALALSESAQRSSGASELGALFIDEGFGSLDASALDTVVAVLRTLPASGRLVGVITHVDEMKRRIPAQLRVERQAVGSRVVPWIDV
jgi:DNA repair protein SbcC/Rad50